MTVSIDAIDAVLPQTQCRECGYAGCRPYATAIIEENAAVNLCPPGGLPVLRELGNLLQQDISEYEATFINRTPSTARIVEMDCIGCTKCIQACPVDAIIGTSKAMHTILSDECTGCGLCIPPCPVDCIVMVDLEQPQFNPQLSRERFHARTIRLQRVQEEKRAKHAKNRQVLISDEEQERKKAYIREALARSSAKKGTS